LFHDGLLIVGVEKLVGRPKKGTIGWMLHNSLISHGKSLKKNEEKEALLLLLPLTLLGIS
jgi:hypothetical protein